MPSDGLCQDGTDAGGAVGNSLRRGQGDLPQNSISSVMVIDPVKRRCQQKYDVMTKWCNEGTICALI
ncbi:hypothetical protein AV530_005496 [Patagioenas fasciata monilis]|uniref:Uncharacterized protein n=1 Tax=Patagioenas fasciata monilis TaxID=372326 RepID=A0A1V4JLM5_PATFA|nr:hypothetical protein AV530_005496 [Patagioenas fasciata monilis]